MSYALLIRPEAQADLHDAYAWYEAVRDGLGEDFLQRVEEALASVQHAPWQYPQLHRSVRRVLIHRFPYAVFYVIEQQRIAVLAILHCHRHPTRWRSRL
jgi:toxin ParE1/3/4